MFRYLVLSFFFISSIALSEERSVKVLRIDGVINPVIAELITKGIEKSSFEGAECLIIELDTPGGLDSSMRSIVKEIMGSAIPIVVYVSPSGARAASAGTFITLASHIAAMAPGTNIGAAHPVSIGGEMDEKMAEKVVNDAAAYIKSIALRRGRNAKWAEEAVRKSISATEKEALELKVTDLISPNLQALLQAIDGREVKILEEAKRLRVKGAKIDYLKMGLREHIFNTLSDPNIAYILMMVGLAGLYFELAHPGVIFPGVIGAICLILSLYALQTLSVNYAGILLILLAIALFIAEIKVSGFGLLAAGGITSLILGSLMLFESSAPYLRLSWKVLIPTVLIISGFFILVASLVLKAFARKSLTGKEGLIGEVGIAKTRLDPRGKVFVHGEYWNAISEEAIGEGEEIMVIGTDNLKLKVKRLKGG